MFCRVCSAYGLSSIEVLSMPVKRFWLFDKNVPRINATDRIQLLDLIICSRDQEQYKNLRESLVNDIGTVALEAPKLDSKGLDGLRNIS